jgi:hypothetical protein
MQDENRTMGKSLTAESRKPPMTAGPEMGLGMGDVKCQEVDQLPN